VPPYSLDVTRFTETEACEIAGRVATAGEVEGDDAAAIAEKDTDGVDERVDAARGVAVRVNYNWEPMVTLGALGKVSAGGCCSGGGKRRRKIKAGRLRGFAGDRE
jgi:hypothetical protein